MAIPFSRTLRSFGADNFRFGTLGSLAAILIIIAWFAWLGYARVPLQVVSKNARLETDNDLYSIASPISGRVVAVHIDVGRDVKEGDVLFELDAESTQLDLAQEATRQAAGVAEIDARLVEIKNEQEALDNERRAAAVAVDEARSRYHELQEAARFAQDEVEKMAPLFKAGILSEIDYLRLQSEAKRKQATAEAMRLSVDRLVWDDRSKENNRKGRLENLKTEIVKLKGGIATSKAAGQRLTHDVERHLVRSPVFGKLGEMSNLRVGSVVHEGDKLGTIIPEGELKAVGYFTPDVALGHVSMGQPAQLRLDGFPWTQYGTIPMTVVRVSDEARDGQVQIEFKLKSNNGTRIPLQHGLTGSIEVEVDRVSPAELLLQIIGKRLQSAAPR
jgi:multidrug resistance efflux pump